jgi:hypothetical protein
MDGKEAYHKKKQRALTGFLAFSFILVLVLVFAMVKDVEVEPDEPDNISAIAKCQRYVLDRLVIPGTAEFAGPSGIILTHKGNQLTIVSYVNTKNSKGDKKRSDFVCIIEYLGDRQWKLVNLELSGH